MRRAVYVLTSFFIVASSFALPLRASNGDHGLKVTNWRAPAVAGSGSKKCATRSRCIKSSRSTGAAGVDGESDEVSMAAARRGPSTSLSLKAVASRLRGGDDDDEAMSPMRRKGLFILTYVAYIAIYLARKPLSVVKPVLQEEEGMTSHQLGGIDTALLGAYAVGQLMIGQVSSFLTRRQMLTVGYILSGLATSAVGFVDTATMMAALSAVAGFAAACVNPLLVIFISELYPASMRASVVGLWCTSQQMGGIVANNFASSLLGAGQSWRNVFAYSGFIVAAFALPLSFAVRPSPRKLLAARMSKMRKQRKLKDPDMGPDDCAAAAPSISEALALPGVASLASSYMLVKMARYCLMLWLPTFLRQKVGMSASQAGSVASLFDAGGVLGGVLAGQATDKLAGGRMLAVSLPMCLACGGAFVAWGLLVAAGTGGKAVHAAAMVAVGFLVAGPDGILGGAASKNLCEYNLCEAPEMAPAVSGLVNGIASLGVIAMSAFTANLVSVFGWSGLFLFLGAMLGASVLLAIPSVMVEGRYFTSTVARAGKK